MESVFELTLKDGVPEPQSPQEMAPLLNQEMALFKEWWAKNGGGTLTRFEEHSIRTYLTQKLRRHLG